MVIQEYMEIASMSFTVSGSQIQTGPLFSLYTLMKLGVPPFVFCMFPRKTSQEEDSGQRQNLVFPSVSAKCLLNKLNLQMFTEIRNRR
jgi:hypothetical protein